MLQHILVVVSVFEIFSGISSVLDTSQFTQSNPQFYLGEIRSSFFVNTRSTPTCIPLNPLEHSNCSMYDPFDIDNCSDFDEEDARSHSSESETSDGIADNDDDDGISSADASVYNPSEDGGDTDDRFSSRMPPIKSHTIPPELFSPEIMQIGHNAFMSALGAEPQEHTLPPPTTATTTVGNDAAASDESTFNIKGLLMHPYKEIILDRCHIFGFGTFVDINDVVCMNESGTVRTNQFKNYKSSMMTVSCC
jgi:hypothetical protein